MVLSIHNNNLNLKSLTCINNQTSFKELFIVTSGNVTCSRPQEMMPLTRIEAGTPRHKVYSTMLYE